MTKTVKNTAPAKATAKAKTAPAAKATAKAKAPAKLTAAQADLIVESKATGNGASHFVASAGGDDMSFPTTAWKGELRAAAAVGQSFKACAALWEKLAKQTPSAKLANGLTGRDAPHASKAVADGRSKAKASAAPAATAKATPAKAKAEPKPAKDADRTYKAVVSAADLSLREGTWTAYMVNLALKHTSTAKADAELAKRPYDAKTRKLDWNWMSTVKGFIAFAA